MALEQEHKFLITQDFPADHVLQDAFALQGLHLNALPQRQQQDTYFDTPTYALLKDGAALRIRQTDGETLACYKSPGKVTGSLHRYEEVEADFAGHWPQVVLDKLLTHEITGTFQPLLTLHVLRHPYAVLDATKQVGELVLDEVMCRDANHHSKVPEVHFKEVELETPADLPPPESARIARALYTLKLSAHRYDKLSYSLMQLGRFKVSA